MDTLCDGHTCRLCSAVTLQLKWPSGPKWSGGPLFLHATRQPPPPRTLRADRPLASQSRTPASASPAPTSASIRAHHAQPPRRRRRLLRAHPQRRRRLAAAPLRARGARLPLSTRRVWRKPSRTCTPPARRRRGRPTLRRTRASPRASAPVRSSTACPAQTTFASSWSRRILPTALDRHSSGHSPSAWPAGMGTARKSARHRV
mmetsp:Transcript_42888/g.100515  ORF Transcript_42888/g.100515 Transcript_42888/m.100515 type:complete len:203 (-) Transcript_42888:479-1087(-)